MDLMVQSLTFLSYLEVFLVITECGGTFTADKGFFSSPFFPSNYPPKMTCTWNIEVSSHLLLFSFSLIVCMETKSPHAQKK